MSDIILDANFLIYCAENRVDYLEQIHRKFGLTYRVVVPTLVIKELEKLSKSATKYSDKIAAVLALKLLKSNNIERISLRGRSADEAILRYSSGNIVATVDLGLRKRVESSLTVGKDRQIRAL